MMENELCKSHSGIFTQVETNKDNISELWKKWNLMQFLLIINLAGIIMALVKLYVLK